MQARVLNPQAFLEFLSYSVFGGLMLYLVGSGKYLSYVTPRMKPYIYFAAIIMLVWAFAGLSRLFRPQYKMRSAHCFVLVLPILLFLLPHNPLNASDLSYTGSNAFAGFPGRSPYAATAPQPADMPADSSDGSYSDFPDGSSGDAYADTLPDDFQTGLLESDYLPDISGLDEKNRTITVSNNDFGLWIAEIYSNIEKYKGYKIEMTGFVFRDELLKLEKDEFVLARLMMSCCAADLTPVGLVCKYEKAPDFKKDTWITVKGTIFIGEYELDGEKYDDPQISIKEFTPAEKVDGYVYLY